MKAALVDVTTGDLVSDRHRFDTPRPASPAAMTATLQELVGSFDYSGPIGVGFPAVVEDGMVSTANNISRTWIGRNARSEFSAALGQDITLMNDADAAAVAEAQFGAARGVGGLVLMVTFGTGIGSGMLVDGQLVPNLELGVLELEGHTKGETFFSAKARKEEGLSWEEWGDRANRFLLHVTRVFSPKLLVIGGGVVKRWELFEERFDPALPIELAAIRNNAGIVGAAVSSKG